MTTPAVAMPPSFAHSESYPVGAAWRAERPTIPPSVLSDLWMIDHCGSTVLRCRCLESSPGRLRLHVPLGYGVAEGQYYELCPQPPGTGRQMPLALMDHRWVRVLDTQLCLDTVEDHVEVTVAFEPDEDGLVHNLAGPVS